MTPDTASSPTNDRERVPCYACAEPVRADARKCRWCGEWYASLRLGGPDDRAEDVVHYVPGETKSDGVSSTESEQLKRAMLRTDALALEIGSDLVTLADPEHSDELIESLKGVRLRIAEEFGVITPDVRVRPNPQLAARAYQLRVSGDVVAEWALGELAIAPITANVQGAVVGHLADLLTREEVAELLNNARQDSPMVVQELIPNMLALGQVRQVLQNLVREGVPIRDLSTILNALADHAIYTKDPHGLTEHVRQALGRTICARFTDVDGVMHAFNLSPDAEQAIQNSIQLNETGQVLMLDPHASARLKEHLAAGIAQHGGELRNIVIIVPPKIRRHVKVLFSRNFPQIVVLSYPEIVPGVQINSICTIEVSGTATGDHGVSGTGWNGVDGSGASSHADTGWLVDPSDPDAPPFPPPGPPTGGPSQDGDW